RRTEVRPGAGRRKPRWGNDLILRLAFPAGHTAVRAFEADAGCDTSSSPQTKVQTDRAADFHVTLRDPDVSSACISCSGRSLAAYFPVEQSSERFREPCAVVLPCGPRRLFWPRFSK